MPCLLRPKLSRTDNYYACRVSSYYYIFASRRNTLPTKTSVVCARHFHAHEIVREDVFFALDGSSHAVPRKNVKLKPGVVPSIFDGHFIDQADPPPRRKPRPKSVAKRLKDGRPKLEQHSDIFEPLVEIHVSSDPISCNTDSSSHQVRILFKHLSDVHF